MSASLPAPTPPGIAALLTRESDGGSQDVAVGTRFAVALVGVPTAGYVWAVDAKPAFLTLVAETGGPTLRVQQKPGFAGGQHWEVFTFAVAAPGAGELRLKQVRPWETDEPPVDRFAVRIEAR